MAAPRGRSTWSINSMTAYRSALRISGDSPPDRVRLATELLEGSEEVVLLDGRLALRPMNGRILCEVIDEFAETRRPDSEYRAMVAAAMEQLANSPLARTVASRRLDWSWWLTMKPAL
jgi:hypothetical protein